MQLKWNAKQKKISGQPNGECGSVLPAYLLHWGSLSAVVGGGLLPALTNHLYLTTTLYTSQCIWLITSNITDHYHIKKSYTPSTFSTYKTSLCKSKPIDIMAGECQSWHSSHESFGSKLDKTKLLTNFCPAQNLSHGSGHTAHRWRPQN